MNRIARVVFLFAVVACSFLPNRASAVLQSINDPVYGPGSITRDTDTGLEWLDLTNSFNQSFIYVASQFGTGGAYEGFHHASSAEVKLYWQHGGISVDTGWSAANYAPCLAMQQAVGYYEPSPGFLQALGFIVDSPSPGYRNFAHINTSAPDGYAASTGPYDSESNAQPYYGHWLIRPGAPVGVESTSWTAIRRLYR